MSSVELQSPLKGILRYVSQRENLGGGGTPIYWEKGCAIFLGYFFNWKINFWVYFVACNKFLGLVFGFE